MDKNIKSEHVSEFDLAALRKIRANVENFMVISSEKYASDSAIEKLMLDIAPQDHKGASPFFDKSISIETLDIDPDSNATHIADLCSCDTQVGFDKYDFVVCHVARRHSAASAQHSTVQCKST